MQGDESPVGPLKLQLPDLSQASDQDKVTVVLEAPDTGADHEQQQQKTSDRSQGDGQAEQTHESRHG